MSSFADKLHKLNDMIDSVTSIISQNEKDVTLKANELCGVYKANTPHWLNSHIN